MIEAMLSSTIADMEEERAALNRLLTQYGIFTVIGAVPAAAGVGSAGAFSATVQMARRAGLYILVMGGRYGFVASGTEMSATEREFEAAVEDNPTKVLVYRKSTAQFEAEQERFVERVRDYQKGYWTTDYRNATELADKAKEGIDNWLKQKILLNENHDIYDQFVLYILSIKPTKDTKINYQKLDGSIILDYTIFSTEYTVTFARQQIATNFWGCVSEMLAKFEAWKRSGYVSE